jgi:hypothetical protein
MGIPLAVLLTLTITTAGLTTTNSAYADSKKAKVSCYDLAIDLVSWDGMYRYIDDDDLAALEDDFGDDPKDDLDPASFDDIIDEHMEDILDDFKDAKCKKHIDKDLKKWMRTVDFER